MAQPVRAAGLGRLVVPGVRRRTDRRRPGLEEPLGGPQVPGHLCTRPLLAGVRAPLHGPRATGQPAAPRRSDGGAAGLPGCALHPGNPRPGSLLPTRCGSGGTAGRGERADLLGAPRLQQRDHPRRDRHFRAHDGAFVSDLPSDGDHPRPRRAPALGGKPSLQLRGRPVRSAGPDALRLRGDRRGSGLGALPRAPGESHPVGPRGHRRHHGRRGVRARCLRPHHGPEPRRCGLVVQHTRRRRGSARPGHPRAAYAGRRRRASSPRRPRRRRAHVRRRSEPPDLRSSAPATERPRRTTRRGTSRPPRRHGARARGAAAAAAARRALTRRRRPAGEPGPHRAAEDRQRRGGQPLRARWRRR
jgi:hypothetical protein